MTAKIFPKDRMDAIKRVNSGETNASQVCRELGISRTIFYRWLNRYKKTKKFSSLIPKSNLPPRWKNFEKLSPKSRLLMVERVKAGESVAKICRLYKVSRPVFYKWFKRYDEAGEGQKLEALWDQKPKIERYYNQTPEEYEQSVLAAVRQYPELSSHKLVWVLPQIGDKPILGNHGVQNVLKRHDLTTYNRRFAYSQAYHQPTPISRFFGIFQSLLTATFAQNLSVRKAIVKGSIGFGIFLFLGLVLVGLRQLSGLFSGGIVMSLGTIFSLLSLTLGMFFFLYSLKAYITIAMVLSFSRKGEEKEEDLPAGRQGSFLSKLFGISLSIESKSGGSSKRHQSANSSAYQGYHGGAGLQADLSKVILERKPFVSIHLATYNEKRVIDRLLTAATSQHYENYEVVIVDDSNDETRDILKKWEHHPRVKVIKRESREGFKGAALKKALEHTDKRAEFVIVFDADFIPYPDTIVQFLKYFQSVAGTLDFKKESRIKNYELSKDKNHNSSFIIPNSSNIAAIQGYQWHVLNKSENWITRGVRTEYAGSYVIERSATEIYSGLKQIAGSVYMIRKDVLQSIGWGTSITEDFQLTLKLYSKGYKVVYTPYIQAPAEAVSTVKRMIRQRMRWAEGHSYNVKRMFKELMFGKKEEGGVFVPSPLTKAEKVEVLYLTPYYLQALLFMAGTFFWFMAEAVFKVTLPFWTEVWGWSLVFTNLFALPLMNLVGLFLEESEEKDYVGLFSFIVLSYLVAPFQGYAAAKGFLEKEEGTWFRTPKTGRITDVFTPGRFYKKVFGWLGRPTPIVQMAAWSNGYMVTDQSNHSAIQSLNNPYLALATANNRFNSFKINRRQSKWVGNMALLILLIFSLIIAPLMSSSPRSNMAYAQTPPPPSPATVVTSIPRSTLSVTSENVGGTNAHVAIITSPNQIPSYKYQFLTGGTRFFVDRKDGQGWVQLISQIQTAPEYMKQQGSSGSFVWRPYGLNIITTGSNVLQGFDRQNQADGSIKLVRTYSTTEEGIAESLTETWNIPKEAEDLAAKGPKATYSMTKNRGIILTKGVYEGTWRMRWAISGITDITADSSDIKDADGWPIRKKSYANNSFSIDVDDFDNIQNDINAFSFSEIAANNKAEILFFKNGTTGNRVVDPTVVATVAQAWIHNKQRNIFYNGTNWFVFYNKGSTSLFVRSASTITGLSSAGETTVLNAVMASNTEWDVYMVNDAKFDVGYIDANSDAVVKTCTIASGTTVDCTTIAASAAYATTAVTITITRTPSADRIWIVYTTASVTDWLSADQTGNSNGISTWTRRQSQGGTPVNENTLIPYNSSDQVLGIYQKNPGGTNSDGISSRNIDSLGNTGTVDDVQVGATALSLATHFGNGVRISDTDFRFAYVDASATNQLIEAQFDGDATWTITEVIDAGGGQTNPSLFYDSQENVEYAFYADSGTPTSIQRYHKPTAGTYSTNWDTKTDVDAGEADNNSLPVTQMHEPPLGATQTRVPRELSWCWRNVNSSNFDVVCANLNLAAVPENLLLLLLLSPFLGYCILRMKKRRLFAISKIKP